MDIQLQLIEIFWTGALDYGDFKTLTNQSLDYGIYCIYGNHVISGPGTLLYIGKACQQTFAGRCMQHGDWLDNDSEDLKFYVGRIGSIEGTTYTNEDWNQKIDDSERLLIHYLSPPYNSSGIYQHPKSKDMLILNLGKRYRLPYCITSLYYGSEIKRKTHLWRPYEYIGK